MTYHYKTRPFRHQHEEFTCHGNDEARGLFWEQGVGKTKPIIDTVAYHYEAGNVDGLMVMAPNGVHENWVSDEIPAHLPDRVMRQTCCHVWYSTGTKRHAESFQRTLRHDGLAVLVMSYNAVLTERGRKAWRQFLKQRRCVYVLDESQRVKNPGAKWSKRILGSHVAAPYRRVLSGTPVANSPFDVYNQLRFLEPDVWRQYGISTFGAFKQFFGVWETWSTKKGEQYPKCVAYRNLNILHDQMHRLGSRLTKDEVLDLPPKLFSKRYFNLTSEQAARYRELKDTFMIEMETGDLTATLAIVRLLRFQQICCGYHPVSDDDDRLVEIPGGNPRLSLLAEICEDLPHKAIIWARFRKDIELISSHKVFRGRSVVIDGSVSGPSRTVARDAFQKGGTQFLIANPAAISTGITLHAARSVIYYSNTFNYEQRVQSEDRAHRIGQEHPVHYTDIVASDSVDLRIVEALRKKLDVASMITGDTLRDWI